MDRLPDWEKRLVAVTEKHMRLPGVWGEADCLMATNEAIFAVTGKDVFGYWRGLYGSPESALALLRSNGCDDVQMALVRYFPAHPGGRLAASRGDVCTINHEGRVAAGWITEYGVAVKAKRGLIFMPQTQIAVAFKVG